MTPSELIESARKTLQTERDGLEALRQAFDGGLAEPFTRAVETISGITGRIIVTGMGKSGHIGAKIAATLASTGTPAFFVHPAEANHGDLGMIAPDDVVLAMSWSGESAELKGIVSYARRFKIPLLAFTCNASSSLGREADICLTLPKVQEACPHGLAPTTSTILQMALGDALAVSLLEYRGFSASDFHVFHPGGSLGASLTHVSEIMHGGERLPHVPLGTAMVDAVVTISEKGFGCVAVTDEHGALVGVVTDGDLRRNIARDLQTLKVDDIMTRSPKAVSPDTLAGEALSLMNMAERPYTALFVVEGDKPVGIVHMHDLLRIGVA
ncbi:MAG: KpsF/GutQ family sugar-phosphate isomerase [Pseudomonadota bacterium]|nr:KpsF/GutQ family sugar-phosphate isomerase [Pseudomonadota bacterium]